MRVGLIALSLLALAACASRLDVPPPEQITRVEIIDMKAPSSPSKVIEDRAEIDRIVRFLRDHSDGWQQMYATPRALRVYANFRDRQGGYPVLSVGVDRKEIEATRRRGVLIKTASPAEISELLTLIGVSPSLVEER